MTARLAPLSGIRVLDFTAFPPGGACTVMLADLGAEVIRVEPPGRRGAPSLVIGQVALSRGKKSLTLDLRHPRSSAVLTRLAPTIDVVIENAAPGAMEARGFGWAQSRAANPRLIWCAITGFGQDGPYRDHAGHDLSYLAHSGLLGALSADQPWQPALSLALQAGGMAAVVAIQAALIERGRSGEGAFVDISLSEAAGWFLTCGINPLSDRALMMPVTPDRRLYLCADDRVVAVACAEPRTWGALCDGLNLPELKPTLHQSASAATTTDTLAAIFRTRAAMEWVDLLAPLGAAVTIVNHAGQVAADAHVVARGSVVDVAGTPVPASPLRIARADGRRTATATEPPRNIGDDTRDILTAAGFSTDEVTALIDTGLA